MRCCQTPRCPKTRWTVLSQIPAVYPASWLSLIHILNKGNPDAKFVEIPDRLDALHYAVDHAQEGDLIAVIGKGHETYRDREGVKTPFLERELLEEYAQQIGLE